MNDPFSAPPENSPINDPDQGDHPQKPRWRKVLIGSVVAVFLVAGTGGTAAYVKHRSDVAQAQREEAQQVEQEALARREAAAARLEAKQTAYDSCMHEVSALLKDLTTVDARLNVGLSQSDFSDLVGDASVSYAAMDVDALGTGNCLNNGVRLETALNTYITVAGRWNDCIYDTYCDMDEIDVMLQRKWATASTSIDKATRSLDRMNPSAS